MSYDYEKTHSIEFINNTNIPVSLETWHQKLRGLSVYNDICVKNGESITMESNTGEWFITTYFIDKVLKEQVQSAGHKLGMEIGKFCDRPCARGNYSWLADSSIQFKIEYKDGTATLSCL
jgi:hypothetical protein